MSVEFAYGGDTNTRGQFTPTWEIDSFEITEGNAGQQTANFTVLATGTRSPLLIQWQRNTGEGFSDIANANSPTYSLLPGLADNGAQFRAVIYIPGAVATSDVATLAVNQPNTPPQFTCGPGQTNSASAGAQTVANWATDIQVHSIERTATAFSSDFTTEPAGIRILDPTGAATRPNPRVEDGVLKLTDALDAGGFGGFAIGPFPPQTFESMQGSWKSRVGGGGGGGADGYSLSIGEDLTDNFTVKKAPGAD